MSTKNQNKEEEVDLGSLFLIIGNGFKRFFNFIGKLLMLLFDFFIEFILFVKLHWIKLVIAAVIGGTVGGYLEYNEDPLYGSDLTVEPNFASTKQLYTNVQYFNDLILQLDTTALSSIFSLSHEKAASLRKFKITPLRNERDIIEKYDELILEIDTLTAQSFTFKEFKAEFSDFDYKHHEIHVEATDNKVFSALDEVVLGSVVQNDYFNQLRLLTRENLYRTDSILRKNLVQLDSLRQVYMTVMLEEAKKESNGTNINLEAKERSTKELELFNTSRSINSNLRDINLEISVKSEVINVISNFQPVGYEIKDLTRNLIIVLSGIAVLLVFVILVLLKFNKYLENYKSK